MSLAAKLLAIILLAGGCYAAGWGHATRVAKAKATAEALERSEAARETERIARRSIDQEAQDARKVLDRLRRDAVAARADSAGLRMAAQAAGRACDGAGSASGGDTTATPGMVLADVFERASDRAAELAGALEESHARGQVCERAYGVCKRACGGGAVEQD